MDRIKGTVVGVIAGDTLLIEVTFIGNFNRRKLPNLVKVQFDEISPPYLKGVSPEKAIDTLNNKMVGQYVSANIGRPDQEGVFRGKITCEGPDYRRKRKYL